MARDCLQPWMDRLAHADVEVQDTSPRARFGGHAWDGQGLAMRAPRAEARPLEQDTVAPRAAISRQVEEDPGWDSDDFDFAVASY
ncbi:hypothetical protein LXT21_16760 [Myxococcus sp. K38C18041901]|uniref:hypothetical protein n=1 Tax=Myxococcus guangdongensis TaxID=2906760 RepID=UPI0020A701D1|nr:hypothetical protein [Myxococcus guangdongensis]MCP3060433.1 hypothetical protein [Myxococcus guangdongensis]